MFDDPRPQTSIHPAMGHAVRTTSAQPSLADLNSRADDIAQRMASMAEHAHAIADRLLGTMPEPANVVLPGGLRPPSTGIVDTLSITLDQQNLAASRLGQALQRLAQL